MNADLLGFRRRCSWCGVRLRGWQLNLCRLCKRAATYSPSPPCPHGSRWESDADDATGPAVAYLIGVALIVAGAVLYLIGALT